MRRVVLDANILILLLVPDADIPLPEGVPKEEFAAGKRVEFLFEKFNKNGTQAVVPTPVLSEILIKQGDDTLSFLEKIQKQKTIRIEPFDLRAAIECAEMQKKFGKRSGLTSKEYPYQKIKFDRQILAIGLSRQADCIFTCDKELSKLAEKFGINVVGIQELPLPEKPPQIDMSDISEDF
ncbi:type II toxin-antitoxin system VapC family toxin [Kiloniella majae]|uniref:type II toxin-antitoxin system VapC family toxin n=1 Tax=Kiloniella majae TaxID=1938558 RepID=UPI000A276FDC|nr:PIN domain-containing protein [Kiloniella majae]